MSLRQTQRPIFSKNSKVWDILDRCPHTWRLPSIKAASWREQAGPSRRPTVRPQRENSVWSFWALAPAFSHELPTITLRCQHNRGITASIPTDGPATGPRPQRWKHGRWGPHQASTSSWGLPTSPRTCPSPTATINTNSHHSSLPQASTGCRL